jgi:hypothetical protein
VDRAAVLAFGDGGEVLRHHSGKAVHARYRGPVIIGAPGRSEARETNGGSGETYCGFGFAAGDASRFL